MEKRTMLAGAVSVLLVVASASAAIGVGIGTRSAAQQGDVIGSLQPVASEEVLGYPERDPSDPPLVDYEFRTVDRVLRGAGMDGDEDDQDGDGYRDDDSDDGYEDDEDGYEDDEDDEDGYEHEDEHEEEHEDEHEDD